LVVGGAVKGEEMEGVTIGVEGVTRGVGEIGLAGLAVSENKLFDVGQPISDAGRVGRSHWVVLK